MSKKILTSTEPNNKPSILNTIYITIKTVFTNIITPPASHPNELSIKEPLLPLNT